MTLTQALGLALGGVPLGAMYALQAMGIVLVYKTSGVFNFAQGAIGMTAAYVASSVGASHGLPTPVAVLAGLAVGVVLGVVIERFTIRPVSGSLQQTVVTLAWLLGLQGLAQIVFVQNAGRAYLSLFPATPALSIRPLFLTLAWDQIGVVIVAVVVAAVLGVFFKLHPLGLKMRAVSDKVEGASLLGINAGRVALISWGLGAGMAALSGILVTPLLARLDTVGLVVFTVQALAAALVGRLTSLPMTFAGGIALGMSQPVLKQLFDLGAGSNELIALLFVLGALLLRKRTGRGDSGGGGLPPSPLRPMPQGRAAWALAGLVVVALVLHVAVFGPGTGSRSWAVTYTWAMGVLSVVLLGGVAGQISLAQAAFMGVGGYGAAIAVAYGVPFLPALVVGGAVAAGVALLVGLPALRLRGLELAIATLSLSFAADRYFFQSFTPLVGPDQRRPLPRPDVLDRIVEVQTPDGMLAITDWRPYAVMALLAFVVVAFAVASLRRSRAGAAFTALRSSEAATAAMGFSVVSVKLRGFALSGFVAGLGGAIFGGLGELANNTAFGFDRSISLVAYAVIAGIGSVPGALIGGAIVTLSTLSSGGGDGLAGTGADWTPVITAVVLMLILRFSPDGLVGLGARLRDAVVARVTRPTKGAEPPEALDESPAAKGDAPVLVGAATGEER